MKITDIKTIALKIPLKEGSPVSFYPNRRRVHILVEVSTDEGIKGYGESIPYTYRLCRWLHRAATQTITGRREPVPRGKTLGQDL